MACGDFLRSSVLSCANILQGGVGGDSRLVLVLKKDIDSYVADGNDIVTAITLGANKSAYSFDGIKQSLKPKFEIAKNSNGQVVYKHIAVFFYFEYNAIAKNNLRQMGNGRYVGFYENSKTDADAFEILGLDVGMEVSEGGRTVQENNGAMRIVLSSPENEFEVKPPRTLGIAYASAKTILDGLLKLPTIGASGLSVTAAAAAGGTSLTITGTNFFGGGVNNGVLKVEYVNNSTGAIVLNITYGAVADTTQAVTTPAMVAGSYRVRMTTIKGAVDSPQNLIVT